jgi:hypothetical protein
VVENVKANLLRFIERQGHFTFEPLHAVGVVGVQVRLLTRPMLDAGDGPEQELLMDVVPSVIAGDEFMAAATDSFVLHLVRLSIGAIITLLPT